MNAIPFIADVCVYGVEVPNYDGKCGMASIALAAGFTKDNVNWTEYHKECVCHLPVYARPVFIRLQHEMVMTSTFKHQKGVLVKEGYDLSVMKADETLLVYSFKDGSVVEATTALLDSIKTGGFKI